MPTSRSSLMIIILLSLFMMALMVTPLKTLIQHSLDPYAVNDDARPQITPFFTYYTNTPEVDPYIHQFYRNVHHPIGFKILYRTVGNIINPKIISKTLPFFLWALILLGLGKTAYKLGGTKASVIILVLATLSPIFWDRLSGGLPRSFAFPGLALTVWGLSHKKWRFSTAIIILTTAFYPVAGAIGGSWLFISLILEGITKKKQLNNRWIMKAFGLLVSCVLIQLLIISPQLSHAKNYGDYILPHQTQEYPEILPTSRFLPKYHLPPHPSFLKSLIPYIKKTAGLHNNPNAITTQTIKDILLSRTGLTLLSVCVLLMLLKPSKKPSKDTWLILSSWTVLLALLHGLAIFRFPLLYAPERYLQFGIPILGLLWTSAIWNTFTLKTTSLPKKGLALIATLALGIMFSLTCNNSNRYAKQFIHTDTEKELYHYINTLPKKSLIAGFPKGPIENITYLTGRATLITFEEHQPYYTHYILNLRHRLTTLIKAMYSTSKEPLIQLKHLGVTHLLIDTRHFKTPPSYFKPFSTQLNKEDVSNKPYYLLTHLTNISLFKQGPYHLIDLETI